MPAPASNVLNGIFGGQRATPNEAPPKPAKPAGKRFKVAKKPGGVSFEEMQEIISTFHRQVSESGKGQRLSPLTKADSGELADLEVFKCFGDYIGDQNCVRCPTRTYCLQGPPK
jgi:hypothetical protein